MLFKKIGREVLSLGLMLVLIFAFKSTFFANYTVPTGSMIPTIEPGDKLFVNQMAYDIRIPFTRIALMQLDDPHPGDVIVCDAPDTPGMRYVKRLIGRPGDHLVVENGFIAINGQSLPTSSENGIEVERIAAQGGIYKEALGGRSYEVQRHGHSLGYPRLDITLPEDCYFAMGDNRDMSLDSRSWGCVQRAQILGKAKFVYFSFDWPDVRWERIGKAV